MNKFFISFLTIAALTWSCQSSKPTEDVLPPETPVIKTIQTFPVNSSIRALEVVDSRTIWFAGSGGVYGHTEDGGATWAIDSLHYDTLVPHFRSIAVTREAIFLLSIASPALLFRSVDQGENWELVYREDHPAAFYDALAFRDEQQGIAMGDPTEGCLSVILTDDGGRTWEKVPCSRLPAAAEGEAAFAASNTNIALAGDHAWLVSGGARARIFHTSDRGVSWEVFDTPIVQGGQMTGIYSVDFYDEKNGILFGGDWNDKDRNTGNKAVTADGGRTWQLIADGQEPGYRSCVQYVPNGQGKIIAATGIPGISWSADGGQSWTLLGGEPYYTLRFGPDWRTAWVAGDKRLARIVWEE